MVPVEHVLDQLKRWPGDDEDLGKPGAYGYTSRIEVLEDVPIERIRSVFEFGGHFGWGIITWLHHFSMAKAAGWIDNESAFPGSNKACEGNIKQYLRHHKRKVDLWFSESALDTAGRQYDLVHVDGEHTHYATLVDLGLAFAMEPSVVLVDDMQLEPVEKAVNEFEWYTGLKFERFPHVASNSAIWRRA